MRAIVHVGNDLRDHTFLQGSQEFREIVLKINSMNAAHAVNRSRT